MTTNSTSEDVSSLITNNTSLFQDHGSYQLSTSRSTGNVTTGYWPPLTGGAPNMINPNIVGGSSGWIPTQNDLDRERLDVIEKKIDEIALMVADLREALELATIALRFP